MNKRYYLTTRWLASAGVSLFGLFCVLTALVFQLESLQVPIALYGYVSLGACSYLTGYSLRHASPRRGFFLLPRGCGALTAILAMFLQMLVSELHFSENGFVAIVVVMLVFLVLGLQHKSLVQTTETSQEVHLKLRKSDSIILRSTTHG